MQRTSSLLGSLEEKELLSASQNIIKNVCLVKIKEVDIIEGSLAWVKVRLDS